MTGSNVGDDPVVAQHFDDVRVYQYAKRHFGPQVVGPKPPDLPSADPAGPDTQASEDAMMAAYVARYFPGVAQHFPGV